MMEKPSPRPEEENIFKDIKNLFQTKKRSKVHCNERYKKYVYTGKRN